MAHAYGPLQPALEDPFPAEQLLAEGPAAWEPQLDTLGTRYA
jgi:hypothetical protein